MTPERVVRILRAVRQGTLTPRAGARELAWLPVDNLGFARIDLHRAQRTMVPEVVFCQGKSLDQAEAILLRLIRHGGRALATRAPAALGVRLASAGIPASYDPTSRILSAGRFRSRSRGVVAVLSAGTSDIPVAEEAARTAEFIGVRVTRKYDAGVAGLHRLLTARRMMTQADALVVAAGMEGALPSVVGGLVAAPVIAVPTSVGYGASYHGLAALLAMMNSCAPGVAVVNIDNGFGAGYLAAMIARRGKGRPR